MSCRKHFRIIPPGFHKAVGKEGVLAYAVDEEYRPVWLQAICSTGCSVSTNAAMARIPFKDNGIFTSWFLYEVILLLPFPPGNRVKKITFFFLHVISFGQQSLEGAKPL